MSRSVLQGVEEFCGGVYEREAEGYKGVGRTCDYGIEEELVKHPQRS